MKPPTPERIVLSRTEEVQCKAKSVMPEIIRLRRAGYPPLTARALAIIQTLMDCQRAAVELRCHIPEGEADDVLELKAFQRIGDAIQENWLVAQRYILAEAQQAKRRRPAVGDGTAPKP